MDILQLKKIWKARKPPGTALETLALLTKMDVKERNLRESSHGTLNIILTDQQMIMMLTKICLERIM